MTIWPRTGTNISAEPNSTPIKPRRNVHIAKTLGLIAGVEKANNMFLSLVILADDRNLFHVETGALQRLHSIFCRGALVIKCNGDVGVICRHDEILC
jgi:hypothetical protein